MFEEEKNLTPQDKQLEQNFKNLIKVFEKIPLPRNQIIKGYEKFIKQNKIKDTNNRLKNKIIETNEECIVKYFMSYMHSVFFDIEKQVSNIKYLSNLYELDTIIQNNLPNFIFPKNFKISKERNGNLKDKQLKEEVTPGFQKMQIQQNPIAQHKKVDLIFSYLFDSFHILLKYFQQYYQLQDNKVLQNAIYQGFWRYAQQNQYSFLNFNDQQNISLYSHEKQVVKFQNPQNQDKKDQNAKSDLMSQLIDIMIENIEDKKAISKKSQYNNNSVKQQSMGKIKLKKYQVNPLQLVGNAYNIIQSMYKKGIPKAIAHTYNQYRSKEINNSIKYSVTEQDQKVAFELANTILKSHIRHNVSSQEGLNPDEFRLIEQYINSAKFQDFMILNDRYTQEQKFIIVQSLSQTIEQLQEQKIYQPIKKKLQQILNEILNVKIKQPYMDQSKIKLKKGIKTTLSTINTVSQLPNIFYFLVLLYKQNEKFYCPNTRRVLLKVCHHIQNKFKKFYRESGNKQYRHFSLVHTLKLLQSQKIQRSQIAKIITNQKPFRESQLPLKNEKEEYFEEDKDKNRVAINQAQLHVQHELNRIYLFQHQKKYQQPPKLQLLKLTHSTNKKNVTILISGFLSEDTNKFQEWMGVLEPTYDSEIYALKWESKTMEHILQFTLDTCKNIALAGAGVSMIGGPYIKAAFILKEIFHRYHQNPFNPAFQVANITGIFFADLIMNLFDGHFINLAGFSLGTQVIASALQQFKRKNKLHMVNRLITMGGVADKNQLLTFLDKTQQNQQKPISIAWTNVFCQTDNILRYLLKVSMPSVVPIGTSEVTSDKKMMKQDEGQKIYEVDNINVSNFVNGHLNYRTNMKTIARLVGIKDQ